MKYLILFSLLAATMCSCSKSDPAPAARIAAKVEYHFTISAVDGKAFVATISNGVNGLQDTQQASTQSVSNGEFLKAGDELWIEVQSNKPMQVNIAADGNKGTNYMLDNGVAFKFKIP